ncbi:MULTISPECIES: polysaccharide biosynthesis/export family protein [Mucilaginibacter]|jgi:polysaccharide export outer membrane protein|uniref:polysaccharide biosynthesis/export family protein n=1 Tax=Mucilaginibacter TaxID=423349 RepID=UPI0008716CF7|nr:MULTISPECIES: polysaccharide biosynthesis/export family protein [Mucilaginibacter]NVM66432.1 polysaccharide export outer membrane protein [Mucilaginibacter sp. SG538B]SCW63606.1 polysaccharide export outer membrane protein [Mucilaginibacter sp. NFR10]
MRKSHIVNSFLVLFILFISAGLLSCNSAKKVKYFQDLADSGQMKTISKADYQPPVIQPDDILTIVVQTIDPQNTAAINVGNLPFPSTGTSLNPTSLSSVSQQPSLGILVDKDGFITIPILGKIKVAGYTTSEATEVIKAEAIKYYKEPTVIVRYANFKVSVTGEVLKPGMYVLPNEKVSVLDAIALAGDLTIFAKRDNVLLIRENKDGTKTPYRFNLKKSDIMSSPYFYLHQNDIIYVEPGPGKVSTTDASQARYYTLVGSLLSVLIVLFTRK